MISPSLCHLEYVLSGCADNGSQQSSSHAVYIPLKEFRDDDCTEISSDQQHFNLTIALIAREAALGTNDSAEELRVTITPKEALTVTSCRLLFSGEFLTFKHGLFNGWQSWTDTKEVSLHSFQRGLVGTPKNIVDKWVLDSSGDYRFVKYASKPGNLHGWSFSYFTRPDTVIFVGGLNERAGFTLMTFEAGEGLNVLPEPPARELAASDESASADVALITVHDEQATSVVPVASAATVDCAFGIWFTLMRLANDDLALPRRRDMLTGYTSWYRHYEDITEAKLASDLEGVTRVFGMLDTEGFKRLFQVDDGFC